MLDGLDAATPELAVVVIALGAPFETIHAVRSVLEQKPAVEVVVVNSGGGGIAQLMAQHGIEIPVIEREEKLYVGAARNIGIRNTRAPYVAFLAADCRATPGWARRRIAAHRAGVAAVGSAVVNSNPHNPFAWAGHLALFSRRMPGARHGHAYGASYDRHLFEAHGFFREDLRTSEDTEFNDRLPRKHRPKWNGKIHTIHRNPTGLLHLIADQFQRGARAACAKELRAWPLDSGFQAWWRRTDHALSASRNVERQYRHAVRLARPLILVAVAAYLLGARSWQRQHRASGRLADPRAARANCLNTLRVEPVIPTHAVLTKHLFGSNWSARRLLRRPRVIAIFSFRYDAHLVPDLIENLRPIVDGYIAYDDRGAREPYTDERARKAVLQKEARDMGAQWLLCIDPDERLEMATSERMKLMTGVTGPVIWTFRLREMYTPHSYRVDGRWKSKRVGCLFPVADGQIFSNAPLHGQRAPINPVYKKRDSRLNLYHLKMITAERREARCDLYKALDPENAYQKIGYDYLGDESGLELQEVPSSRQYRPLHREKGGIWQPNLSAVRPGAEIA